ncbi:hypothetical protein AMECASPLE_008149 [Ameca splendens]|uniref:Uncharacterized protein n=1 Tax=Ameca splendens TaxID=208324 RepID=A0ABV0YMC5_9TELE
MKKGLHFLGRKNQSLYDTNIKIQDRDSVELVLDSESAVFESGTANVRARPTVKHHATSFETFQGFAVPTPKVPELPLANGPKINGTDTGDSSSIGSFVSAAGHVEGKIFVPPPPPSVAPPPPPVDFIPPPPDFMGDLNTLDPVVLQPPSMSAPKPPSMVEEDLSLLKPPPMAPPKPPSACSSGSGSSVPPFVLPPSKVPERPNFAPPQPPMEKQPKSHKIPPPKPIRMSSVSTTELPQNSPAPLPLVHMPSLSTFNPQNKSKVYDPPKTTVQSGYDNQKAKPQQMLALQESGSVNSAPVVVAVNGKAPTAAQLTKPEPKPVEKLKEALEVTKQSQLPEIHKETKTEVKTEVKTGAPTEAIAKAKVDTVPAPSDITKSLQPLPLQKTTNDQFREQQENNKKTLEVSSGQGRSFSPLLDRKLYNLKANETKPSSTSPLALLKAAKEREKNRTTQSLSRECSTNRSEPTNPNSFTAIPKSAVSAVPSQKSLQENASVRPAEPKTTTQAPEKPIGSTALAKDQKLSSDPVLSKFTAVSSPTMSSLGDQKQRAEEKLLKSQDVQNNIPKEEVNLPMLPPPPEFDDFDQIPEPSIRPPDPPATKVPTPLVVTKSPDQALASAPAPVRVSARAPAPSSAPSTSKLPPPDVLVKPKTKVQTKSSQAPTQLPSNLSPKQATLLSILQKKMLEMDQKMAPGNESERSFDDWGTALSDEDNKVPAAPQSKPVTKYPPAPTSKTASLDMRALENKVAKKYHQSVQVKSPPRNGIHSGHQYGRTFTIRPGTKDPITLVNKGDS